MQLFVSVTRTLHRLRLGWGISIILFGLGFWILLDLTVSRRADMRQFDSAEVGRLDAAIWQSYYERRPLRLFSQVAELMRVQYQAPYWRSWVLAYQAGKAAFVFQDGKNRQEYTNALPYLEKFYRGVNDLAQQPFNVQRVAQLELDWWICRREKERFQPADWERMLAEEVGEIYRQPADRCREHAQLRVRAMMYCDQRNQEMAETDWQSLRVMLTQSWNALYTAVN